jgi:hypothetical protein
MSKELAADWPAFSFLRVIVWVIYLLLAYELASELAGE